MADSIQEECIRYEQLIKDVGGIDNLSSVDNCATSLRLEVKDSSLINEKALKSVGARGIVHLNKCKILIFNVIKRFNQKK